MSANSADLQIAPQEFFLALAKQDAHSFMMLGAITKDEAGNNVPKLLARVGKVIDTTQKNSCLQFFKKVVGSGILAYLNDEGVSRTKSPNGMDRVTPIAYQAYAINYNQYIQFLELIAGIQRKQWEDPEIKAAMLQFLDPDREKNETDEHLLARHGIKAYIPINNGNNQISLTYTYVSELQIKEVKNIEAIAPKASRFSLGNTCRTTALNMVEAVLGFTTKISNYFFISPKHQSKLINGCPEAKSFYVLPLPPGADLYPKLSAEQIDTLNKMFQRMEEMVVKDPDSDDTRTKFERLKELYISIAGSPEELPANELLVKICDYEKNHKDFLYKPINPNWFSKMLGLRTSTENLFINLKDNLKRKSQDNVPHSSSKPKNGFTLVELVLVIMMISVLLMSAMHSFGSWRTRAEVAVAGEQFYRVYQAMIVSCMLNQQTGNSEAAIANLLEKGKNHISEILPSLNGGKYSFNPPLNCSQNKLFQATLITPPLSDEKKRICNGALAHEDPAQPCE